MEKKYAVWKFRMSQNMFNNQPFYEWLAVIQNDLDLESAQKLANQDNSYKVMERIGVAEWKLL